MTEAEWLAVTDPDLMLGLLRGKASDRKLRLFGCACCRRIWRYVDDQRCQNAIKTSEDYADGMLGLAELEQAAAAAWGAANLLHESAYHASKAAAWVADGDAETAAIEAADAAISATVCDPHDPEEDHLFQADTLRCIFGNPFRPVAIEPSWLTSTVHTLAEGIYAERAFDRMPILADALQDAGCEHPDILAHCRGGGPHVRGCWVIDLLLGKA